MPGSPRFGTVAHVVGTTFLGADFNDHLGVSVASIGDLDNDGVRDLIIGADLDDVGGTNRGSVRVVSGATGAVIDTFRGDAAGDFFGHSVASAGDVNGDGVEDIIIGAHVADPNGSESGFARVLSGADGATLHTFGGDSAGDRMGVSVASAGDVDGDGTPDLIVGANLDDNNAAINSGSARVFSGATGAILYTFNGLAASDEFGTSVASAGDVDGDGRADLIVGSPMADGVGANAGMAQVFSGATGAVLHTFTGGSAADNFGVSVASLGDVDGDGLADLAIGANLDDNTGLASGSVRVVSGATGATLYTVNGSAAGAQFGFSIAAAGDLDGDGVGDMIVGAPEANGTTGVARLVSGATGGTIAVLTGDDADDNFGFAVASAGDLNGDGFADVFVGADDDETNGPMSGLARTFLSQQSNLLDNAPAFTEDAAPVLLDGDVAIADAELDFANSYAGAGLTLARVGGANAEDVFAGSGTVSLVDGDLIVSGVVIGDYVQAGGELVITFNAAATTVRANAVLRSLTYANASHSPPASVAIAVTFSDGDPVLPQSVTGTVNIAITSVEDPTLAFDDAVFTPENTVLTGSVFADNGFGADNDLDGPPPEVGLVNGSAAAVGQTITLASGAALTVNADGTFSYDPFNLFTALGGPASGAANTTVVETFTYALVTGQTATVTLTVNGVDGADVLVGTAGADDIDAGVGDDFVRGSAGDDSLDGGAGIDVLDYTFVGGAVSVNLGAGRTSADGTGGVDLLAGFEHVRGTAFNDVIAGAAGNNILIGGAGADTLLGQDGNDILIGGAGAANQLQGGLGDDQYFVTANDSIFELAGQGFDRVFTDRASFTLAANVEGLVYTGLAAFTGRGNAVGNIIAGGGADDVLSGGGGRDTLQGGAGVDRADYSAAAGAVVADLTLGTASSDGDGSDDILTGIENLTGSAAGDTLSGGAGVNLLEGGGGADVLAGRGGNDTLLGQGGVDTADYSGAAAAVSARLDRGEINDGDGAVDTVDSIENLIGSAFNDLLVGSAANNSFAGGAGRDTLLGLAGNDVLSGGQGLANQLFGGIGDDTYVLEAVGDTIIEAAGAGTDTARVAFSQFNLAAHVENALYTGAGNFAVTGNALANVLSGGAGLDTLTGGAGNDTLNGGDGRDTARMTGGSTEYFFVDLGDGRLRIADSVSGRDGVDVLNGIEAVHFSDGVTLELDASPAPALFDKDLDSLTLPPASGDDWFAVRADEGWMF